MKGGCGKTVPISIHLLTLLEHLLPDKLLEEGVGGASVVGGHLMARQADGDELECEPAVVSDVTIDDLVAR